MFFVAFTAFLLAGWPDAETVEIVTTVVFPLLGLLYVPLAALAAVSARDRLRVAWLVLAIGLATWAVGDAISGYYAVMRGREPFPSCADAAYLAGFYDQSHLIREFKAVEGITPMTYRQKSLARQQAAKS